MIAHVYGLPVEELLGGAGAGAALVAARAWVALHVRRRPPEGA